MFRSSPLVNFLPIYSRLRAAEANTLQRTVPRQILPIFSSAVSQLMAALDVFVLGHVDQ